MLSLLLFTLLALMCWPLALLVAVLMPLLWLLSLPFRLAGIVVEGVFQLVGAILLAPVRVLRAL